jgi:uncharacterized protein YeaO (DUF488 family)
VSVRIKRVYNARQLDDGYRVLVDRLWPRGLSKERAAIDLWCKEVAPTSELRRWFDHQPDRFVEFTARYVAELDSNPATEPLREIVATKETVTLLYGARDELINQAAVLADYLSR